MVGDGVRGMLAVMTLLKSPGAAGVRIARTHSAGRGGSAKTVSYRGGKKIGTR